MVLVCKKYALAAALSVGAVAAGPCCAQQTPHAEAPLKVTQIIGLHGVKAHAGGTLAIDGGSLQFTNKKDKAPILITSMQDIVTGNDSQRVFRGTVGTLTMFGPYESGRFLSLFRSKLDTLTIQYADSDGALHGVIFTMPTGRADVLKKQLIALGGHSTVAPEDDKKAPDAKAASGSKGGKS